MSDWNSTQYTKFERERTQPSIDLINRISIEPKTILDIGCGPGNSTAQLLRRFPKADILGIDSSDNMLEKATASYPEIKFRKCFVPDGLEDFGDFDLIFSNACLHWIPDHKNLLPKLIEKLTDGGVLAVQMPLVQNAIFYRELNSLVAEGKWQKLNSIHNFHNLSPEETYNILCTAASEVEMWDTSYYHIVPTHSAVIDWYKGSGLRPYLEALDEAERDEFVSDLLGRIKANYPVQADGNIILKMPRLFFTAMK